MSDLTPRPDFAPEYGSAGFCTDHGHTPDERTETVARVALAERIETAMTDDGHRMPRSDETRYLAHVAAGEVGAVVAALDDESARLRASADAWWSEYDRELTAHEATKAEVERLWAQNRRLLLARNAARAALDRVAAVADKTCFGYIENLIRGALDPEGPR